MALQRICEDAVVDTEGALGCLLLDMNTGLVLALARRPGHVLDDVGVERIVVASESLFRGNLMAQFNGSLTGGAGNGGVREAQVTKAFSYEFMTSMPGWDDGILVFIAERTLSIGIGWMVAHRTRARLAEARRSGARDLPSGEGASAQPRLEWDERYGVLPPAGRRRRIPDQAPAADLARGAAEAGGAGRPLPQDEASGAGPGGGPTPSAEGLPAGDRAGHDRPDVPAPDPDRGRPADIGTRGAGVEETPQPGGETVSVAPAAPADQPETPKPVASGPRARMFRSRRDKR